MPSQEESAQFELEFNLRNNERHMVDVGYEDANDVPKSKTPAVAPLANVVPEHAVDDNDEWEEQDSQGGDGPTPEQIATAPSRKRYTQKRSTRLHKSKRLSSLIIYNPFHFSVNTVDINRTS
jgi:hypothetical protein